MTETKTILSQDCQYPDRDVNCVSPDCDGHALPLEPAWLVVKICTFVSISCANEVKVRMVITVTKSNPKIDIEILKQKPLAGPTARMLPGVSRKAKVAAKSLCTS